MKSEFDALYPEFFRSGLGKLRQEAAKAGDFLALFSALEQFRRDLNTRDNPPEILRLTQIYIEGLDLFGRLAFYLINPADLSFEMALCSPETGRAPLENLVQQQMRAGKFAWALRQSGPAFFVTQEAPSVRGVFHVLSVASHSEGMFCGILQNERVPRQEISFSLLTILLGACADALSDVRATEELRQKILAANRDLRSTLEENRVLARLPGENPLPVMRIAFNGRILYGNEPGLKMLAHWGLQAGDVAQDPWRWELEQAARSGGKRDFEVQFGGQEFSFAVVPVLDAGYANFYGTDITIRKQAERQREQLIGELREALAKVKMLDGLLPMCAWCKKIRDDQGYWKQLEHYIETRSEAVFSHGVCPDCSKKFADGIEREKSP